MIKFLGHTINLESDQYLGRHFYETTFAPIEYGESCLMTGPNKPNYETYLEQESFLKNVYIIMQGDDPQLFYNTLKRSIENEDEASISKCKELLEGNQNLRFRVMKLFLAEVDNFYGMSPIVSSYHQQCNASNFGTELIKDFLEHKRIQEKKLANQNAVKRKALYIKRGIVG